MSAPPSNLDLVKRFYDAIDTGDLAAIDDLCADDFRLHFPGVPVPLDRASTKGIFGGFAAAIGDLRHTVEDQIAGQCSAAIRLTISGTHRGALNGIPPTGKDVTITALNLFHLADGKIAEQWVEYDGLGLLQQLGVMPAAPRA